MTIAFAAFLSGCGDTGSDRVVLRSGTRYLPLLDDRVLKYVDKNGGESKPYTMKIRYAGGNIVRAYSIEFKGIDLGPCGFICKDSTVFFVTGKAKTALIQQPEYRELWVKEPAQDGDSWDNEILAEQTVFAGYETITVAAGTFENCYKTVTSVQPVFLDSLRTWRDRGGIDNDQYNRSAQYAGLTTVRWFAQGVGLVKEQIGTSDHMRELTAIVKPGTGLMNPPSTEQNQQTK
jgi:hypothetical protein